MMATAVSVYCGNRLVKSRFQPSSISMPALRPFPLANLRSAAKGGANPSRFLAAGYVVVVPTYRRCDVDPQSPVSLDDSVAMITFVGTLPYVDSESIVVFGCSGAGSHGPGKRGPAGTSHQQIQCRGVDSGTAGSEEDF